MSRVMKNWKINDVEAFHRFCMLVEEYDAEEVAKALLFLLPASLSFKLVSSLVRRGRTEGNYQNERKKRITQDMDLKLRIQQKLKGVVE